MPTIAEQYNLPTVTAQPAAETVFCHPERSRRTRFLQSRAWLWITSSVPCQRWSILLTWVFFAGPVLHIAIALSAPPSILDGQPLAAGSVHQAVIQPDGLVDDNTKGSSLAARLNGKLVILHFTDQAALLFQGDFKPGVLTVVAVRGLHRGDLEVYQFKSWEEERQQPVVSIQPSAGGVQ